MFLSGINAFSLIEYPGKISCVVYTTGCNLRCDYCHNKEFVLPELIQKHKDHLIADSIFFRFLEKRKGLLDGVSICGGEPTLQKDIFRFCETLKQMGYQVKLDTNGTRPDVIQKLLEAKLVDYIAMDVKYDFENLHEITGKKEPISLFLESIRIIQQYAPDYEFRTTCIFPYHSEKVMEAIGNMVQGAKQFFLQNFRKSDTLNPFFLGEPLSSQQIEAYAQLLKKYVVSVEIRV